MIMKPNQFLGLIKFFKNESHLNKLISGRFHCTPPEVYRMHEQEGVSDKFESCAFSYREERNDEKVTINVGGFEINDALSLTIHNSTDKDAWMHCWFSLHLPKNQEALDELKSDINKMKNNFGSHYAFIPAPNLKPLVTKIQELSKKILFCGDVKYSYDSSKWGTLHKSLDYAYQREYRFLFGECSTGEKEYYIFNNPEGFQDLILKNVEIKLQNENTGHVWFNLEA